MTLVVPEGRRALRKRAKARRRVSVVGVIGEVFITGGVIVLLFLGWELWFNDIVLGAQANDEGDQLSQEWNGGFVDPVKPTTPPAERPDPGEPVVAAEPAFAETFATLIVPRFGSDYNRPIGEGVSIEEILNPIGIGHYPGTAMPGAIGNSAFAAHRMTWGGAFGPLNELRLGDNIYVETPDGWYQYRFRSLEYVLPTGVGVIEPVPQEPGMEPTQRLITLTTCNPKFSVAERLIAYGEYVTWYPRDGGMPPELAGPPAVDASADG